jgi:hypothetical protein
MSYPLSDVVMKAHVRFGERRGETHEWDLQFFCTFSVFKHRFISLRSIVRPSQCWLGIVHYEWIGVSLKTLINGAQNSKLNQFYHVNCFQMEPLHVSPLPGKHYDNTTLHTFNFDKQNEISDCPPNKTVLSRTTCPLTRFEYILSNTFKISLFLLESTLSNQSYT